MATFTFTSVADQFPVGTSVGAYLARYRRNDSSPSGSAATTATVASSGSLEFTGLADDTEYVAYASVSGAHRYRNFQTFRPRYPEQEVVGPLSDGYAPRWSQATGAFVAENPGDRAIDVAAEADPSGVAVVTSDLVDLADTYSGQRALRFRAGSSFRIDDRWTIPANTHLIFEAGSRLLVDGVDSASGTAMVYAAGSRSSYTNLTSSITAGAQSVSLPTGQGASVSVGDQILFEAATVVQGSSLGTPAAGQVYAQEQRKITKVTSDTIELDAPLDYPYATGDGAKYAIVSPLDGLIIDGLPLVSGSNVDPGTDKSYGLRLEYARGAVLRNISLSDMLGGVLLSHCYETDIDGLRVNRLASFADAYGYGLALAGSTTMTEVRGLVGRGNRHLFTTLSEQRADSGGQFWGGPMHAQIIGAIGYGDVDGYSIFDTHQGGRHIDFIGGGAFGGGSNVSGYQIRAPHCRLIGAKSWRNGLRAVNTGADASDLTIEGGTFGYAGSNGISLAASAELRGARVRNNGGVGVAISSGAADVVIQGNVITDNTSSGIQDLGGTNPRIIRNHIPQSATQTVSILNLGATGAAIDNALLGYGTGATGMSGTNASALLYDNLTTGGYAQTPIVQIGSTTEIIYKAATASLRTDAALVSTKGLRSAVNIDTTGLTSAQIDAAYASATGVGAADGLVIYDATNVLVLMRVNAKWQSSTVTEIS